MQGSLHIKIGRSNANNVVVQNDGVADEHLELFCDERDHVFVTDLNSIQGTFINGKRLRGYTLLDENDEVILGNAFKLNWKKYREIAQNRRAVESKQILEKEQAVQPKSKVSTKPLEPEPAKPKPKPIEKQEKQNKVRTKSSVSILQLLIIYGLILVVVFMMVVFG